MDDATGKPVPPPWYALAHKRFDDWDEARVTAVYGALRQFERKYWTMTAHADDPDFWIPGGSAA
jgi:hypothetical protein